MLRSLRRDRTYVSRFLALLLFISMSLITIGTLHFHEQGQLRNLEIMNVVSGIIISAVFIYGAIDLAKRNINYESVKKEREKISTKLSSSQALKLCCSALTTKRAKRSVLGCMACCSHNSFYWQKTLGRRKKLIAP